MLGKIPATLKIDRICVMINKIGLWKKDDRFTGVQARDYLGI
ncbi:MAG: hypothetical protein ACXAEU_05740 [Candidatus Hodarchaeales archaeon]|jgi:hypothetical protein